MLRIRGREDRAAAPIEKWPLAVSFSAARHAIFLWFLLVLVLLALLTLLRDIIVGFLIVLFTGSLGALSALSIFWHGFVSLITEFTNGQDPGHPAQVYPVHYRPGGCGLAQIVPASRAALRASCAPLSGFEALRTHGDAVNDSADSPDRPRKLFGPRLQFVVRNLPAEHRSPPCDFYVYRISA